MVQINGGSYLHLKDINFSRIFENCVFVSNTISCIIDFHNGYFFLTTDIPFSKRQFHFHDEYIEFHEVEVVGVELLVSTTLKITRKYRSSIMSENNQSCQSTILSRQESYREDIEL